jgi:hypothetical protein
MRQLYLKYNKLSRKIFRRLKKVLDNIANLEYNILMKKYQKKPWSQSERKLLSLYYFHASIDEVMGMIPDRTETAIRNQVAYLRKRGIRFK